MFHSKTQRISRLSDHEIINSTSSFDHYVLTTRNIKKIKQTEKSLNARLSNDVKFESFIFKKMATR